MSLALRNARWLAVLLVLGGLACEEDPVLVDGRPSRPQQLTYRLEPSGDPDRPAGIVLSWADVPQGDLEGYRVYSRGSSAGAYGLRGITTSNSFHDNGVPHLQYYVTAVDLGGDESEASDVVTIDEFLRLEQPLQLRSVSLDQAVHLLWSDNAFLADPARFAAYHVYGTPYDLDTGTCDTDWVREGTTVAPEFLAAALPNGEPRCFGVSAVSDEGYESLWSPLWQDTPRPDARNVLVFAYDEFTPESGFRFWEDLNGDGAPQDAELGLVVDGDRTDIDFWIERDPVDSSLWFVPEFAGTRMQVYGAAPVADLTEIDFAPELGYARNAIEAVPGYGYVFEIVDGLTLRYGALRVTHVGRRYLIFDWSFQTDVGNPELVIRGGLAAVSRTGAAVRGPN
jgi:hypothetical protein